MSAEFLDTLDYRVLLPVMAAMPPGLGYRLSLFRGDMNFRFDREWRNYLAGRRHVRDAVYEAMKRLNPSLDEEGINTLVKERFRVFSREEWETASFGSSERIRTLYDRCVIENIQPLLENSREGKGLILLSCHFDSFTMGLLLLGMAGLHANGMSSAVVEDPGLPGAVRAFFFKKYRNMERYMGRPVVHQERDRLFFYRALGRGDAVFMVGELPPSPGAASVRVRFLGRDVSLAGGSWRMARKTGSLIGAYVCLCEGPGRYRVVCHGPVDPASGDAPAVLAPIYSFFTYYINKYPQRWWASDLLTVYCTH